MVFRTFIKILIVVILVNLAISTLADDPVWEQVGPVSLSDNTADYIDTAYDSSGNLYVSFQDCNVSCGVTVKKYDGTSWSTLGTSEFTGFATYISLAINSEDTPYVAYAKCESSCGATVKAFDGSSWSAVGAEEFSAAGVENVSIDIDSTGIPYVAYKDLACSNSCGITVKKYESGVWSTVDRTEFSAGEMSLSTIAIDSNDMPYVAFSDWTVSSAATVMLFNGLSWEYVGAQGIYDNQAGYLSFALDEDNTPYIAFIDNSNNPRVMKFNGLAWEAVGSQPIGSAISGYTSIAFDLDGKPLVAFMDGDHDYKGTVKTFDGSSWSDLGTSYFTGGQANTISLSVSPSGTVYFAFQDAAHDNKLSVMRYDAVGPSISEVAAVESPASDTTPSYTFTTNEAGTIAYGGSCSSVTTTATVGENTIIFSELPAGEYSNCTIVVTDAATNDSNILSVSAFTITSAASPAPEEENGAETIYGSLPPSALRYGVVSNDGFPTSNPNPTSSYGGGNSVVFTKNLFPGMTDPDVKRLQMYLNNHGFVLSDYGGGSPGHETEYFGVKTKAAVTKFQETHRLQILFPLEYLYGTGNLGPYTRAFINAHL